HPPPAARRRRVRPLLVQRHRGHRAGRKTDRRRAHHSGQLYHRADGRPGGPAAAPGRDPRGGDLRGHDRPAVTVPDRATIVAALAETLGADAVVTEPHELVRYEQGWRYGRGTALAAVRPAGTEGVARLLAFAHQRAIGVVAQGANTGLVGASTPDGSGRM